MIQGTNNLDQPRSYFARRLAADPELAARCEKIARDLRDEAGPDIQACIHSRQLGPGDLDIIMNARDGDIS